MIALSINIQDHVDYYRDLGFGLVPLHTMVEVNGKLICSCLDVECPASGKHPNAKLARHGLKDASSDPEILKRYFPGIGAQNIGIATGAVSGIFGLDIDKKYDGEKSLQELEEKYGQLPNTMWWKTGGGGKHMLFRHSGKPISNSAGVLGRGIDVRGDGGMLVAPPSLHASGARYAFPSKKGMRAAIAPPPPWLLSLLEQKRDAQAAMGTGRLPVSKIANGKVPEGQRNMTITRLTGYLLSRNIAPNMCLDLMLAFNEARCRPPLADAEVIQIVTSIDRRHFSQITR